MSNLADLRAYIRKHAPEVADKPVKEAVKYITKLIEREQPLAQISAVYELWDRWLENTLSKAIHHERASQRRKKPPTSSSPLALLYQTAEAQKKRLGGMTKFDLQESRAFYRHRIRTDEVTIIVLDKLHELVGDKTVEETVTAEQFIEIVQAAGGDKLASSRFIGPGESS